VPLLEESAIFYIFCQYLVLLNEADSLNYLYLNI